MSQRRKTYVATVRKHGIRDERPIRAYSSKAVSDYYERQGYEVLAVKAKPRQRRAPVRPLNQFKLNTLAIHEAKKFFNLRYPVSIRVTNHQGGRMGGYRPANNGLSHEISIKSWLTPEQASETLWHELAHAMQNEREQNSWEPTMSPAYKRMWEREKGQYKRAPSEREANRFQLRGKTHPLARPV